MRDKTAHGWATRRFVGGSPAPIHIVLFRIAEVDMGMSVANEEQVDSELHGEDEAQPVLDRVLRHVTTAFFYAVAGCILYVGFLVIFRSSKISGQPIVALYFFLGAAGVVLARELIYLFPKIERFKAAGVEIDLVKKDVRKMKKEIAKTQYDLVAQNVGGSANAEKAKEAAEERGPDESVKLQMDQGLESNVDSSDGPSVASSLSKSSGSSPKRIVADRSVPSVVVPKIGPITNKADQQKGRFGEQSESAGRILTATVRPDGKDWFEIRLTVRPKDGAPPIKGYVTFYLHQSFPQDEKTVLAKNGKAQLVLHAYGAFTVGAVLDGGNTLLELDLSTLKGAAPEDFLEN